MSTGTKKNIRGKSPFAASTNSYRGTPGTYQQVASFDPEAPVGYTLEMYYDIVTTESAEDGDVAERGYVVEGQRYPIEDLTQGIPKEDRELHEAKYGSLEEVVDDLDHYSWVEWSGSPASTGDWLTSSSEIEDYSTDEHISYSAFINHADGSDLTPEEMQYVHDRLGLHGKVHTAMPQSYSEVTEQDLMDEINESERKIEILEEAGDTIAAREERRVLDDLLAMYGDDEYVDEDEETYWTASFQRTATLPVQDTPPWLKDQLAD